MCEICSQKQTKLMSKEIIEDHMIGWNPGKLLAVDLHRNNLDLVLEIRNSQGYLRLGDIGDMQCLDHGKKIKVNFCFNCGEKLS